MDLQSVSRRIKSGEWSKRKGYEIGWCGQNASFANSLLFDYIKHKNKESLDKGVATLDAWAKLCRLPNGLFITNYDRISGQRSQIDNVVIDACNLGTAALNYFEATELVKACGLERPDYESLAFGICDFVRNDQQDNGVYGRGWYPNGECFYREGTIGCFMVPPHARSIHAFERLHLFIFRNPGLRSLCERAENKKDILRPGLWIPGVSTRSHPFPSCARL